MQNQIKSLEVIKLTGKTIDGNLISCTGHQLISILQRLSEYLQNCNWYIADISANVILPGLISQEIDSTFKIGQTEELIEFTKKIDQFLSGIFLAVPINVIDPKWNRSFDTEDEPTNNIGDALIEIRAFDTTYFEIYSSKSDLLKVLLEDFQNR